MKKKNLFAAMLAMALTFGMAVVGCDNGSTDDGGNPGGNPFIGIWTGTVTFSGQSGQGTISVSSITDGPYTGFYGTYIGRRLK
jgi:hypothetical protein